MSPRRGVIWAYLVGSPGRTAHEIARGALGLRGPTGATLTGYGSVCALLRRMESDGQLTRQREFRRQQGREVSVWFAMPGAFAITDEAGDA